MLPGVASKAPMLGGLLRVTPRWSVVMPARGTPLPMAGLPDWSAMVWVGPPLARNPLGSGGGWVGASWPARGKLPGLLIGLLAPLLPGVLPPLLVLLLKSVMVVGPDWPRMLLVMLAVPVLPLPSLRL